MASNTRSVLSVAGRPVIDRKFADIPELMGKVATYIDIGPTKDLDGAREPTLDLTINAIAMKSTWTDPNDFWSEPELPVRKFPPPPTNGYFQRLEEAGLSEEEAMELIELERRSGNLHKLCLAVGPHNARVIRQIYLKNNNQFLATTNDQYMKWVLNTPKTVLSERQMMVINRYDAWMEVNADWKTKCCSVKLMQELRDIPDVGRGHQYHPWLAFNNPAVATCLGLTRLLRFHLEKNQLDVNSCEWSGLFGGAKRHLLVLAATHTVQSSGDTVKYLLSRPDLDAFSLPQSYWHLDNLNSTLFMFFLCGKPHLDEDARIFNGLVGHPNFCSEKEVAMKSGARFTPLQLACMYLVDGYRDENCPPHARFWRRFDRLLEAGANPYHETTNMLSPMAIMAQALDHHRVSRQMNYGRFVDELKRGIMYMGRYVGGDYTQN